MSETSYWAYRDTANPLLYHITALRFTLRDAQRHYGPMLVGPIDEDEWNVIPTTHEDSSK